jgi:serine/threonine protein kinase
MIYESTLRLITDIFIGDNEGYYNYKTGGKLVKFFNLNFGFSDVYGAGFPSRWLYTVENLKRLNNSNRFEEFLTLILSKKYIKRDCSIGDVEALERIMKTIDYLNGEMKVEGNKLKKAGDNYSIVSFESDLEYIGEGGFATVYKSKSSGLIVKILKDDYLTDRGIRHRFKREYDITKSLDDIMGIISVYEYDENNCSYTMEKGEKTLSEYMHEFDQNEENKIKMIRQILHIMKKVHDRNIIHRDISPQNILLFSGQLKISDFGLGKDLEIFHSHRTVKTNSMGQYSYCAPEQFMQLKDGDKRSDVYSLGSLINFIMTGDPRDARHFLRNPVEKAKNENSNSRYADAGSLICGVECSIKVHYDSEHRSNILNMIENKEYSEDIENYICNMSGKELCAAIMNSTNFLMAVHRFIERDEKRATEIMQLIEAYYVEVCDGWEDYDNFGILSYNVIKGNYNYVAKEISSRIMHNVAYNVRRYNIQDLLKELITNGIDPTLEGILIE